MQQPSSLPVSFFYPSAAANLYNQDGGGVTHPGWHPDNAKPNQYPNQGWDNNGPYHVTGNNYGPGQVQVQSGGGQSRMQVGPQQAQQPNQPPPTSTPPNIHPDMNKQPVMQNQQQAQMNYVQARQMNPNFPFPRGGMQQSARLQNHNRTQIVNAFNVPLQQMLASAPTQTIVQTAYPATALMYGQPRQGAPYPNQGQFLLQQQPTPAYFNTQPAPYYSQVLPSTYPQMPSGGPSPQGGTQQPPVSLMRPATMVPSNPAPPPVKQEPKKRPNAIKIIDPETNEEVAVDESGSNNNNITPTRSNDSSARETPQPNTESSSTNNAVAAEFAAKVAARAMDSESTHSSSEEPLQDSLSSDSEIHHKQLPTVPNSEKVVNTVLSTSSEEFIPRAHGQVQPCETLMEETRTTYVPTVSAESNSPIVEIPRPKDQFPGLRNTNQPSGPISQSPLKVNSKKPKSGDNERQQASVHTPVQIPPPPVDNKDTFNNKKGLKITQKEEAVAPKEKREKPRVVSKEQSPPPSPTVTPDSISGVEFSRVSGVKPSPLPPATFTKEPGRSSVASTPSVPVEEPQPKVQQHQNGETAIPEPVAAVDGNKTTRHSKSKKPGKMRELNRKGIEKEGSDMDAFMETNVVSEGRPQTPGSPQQIAVKRPATPPPPLVDDITPQPPVDKIKEDMEEKEDKMVAAKNEENTKVSQAVSETAPTIMAEKPGPPQLTLKHSYKKDQWSPLNLDGKKKYEREFLLELKAEPQSQQKPDNLPDVVAVLRDTSNNMRNQSMNFVLQRGDLGGVIHPLFMQRSSQSQRGQIPKQRSQQGSKGKSQGPKVIHMSLNEDVKLKTAENAWKPTRLATDAEKSEEEKQTEELYKNVRGILNKLTPQKFDTLMNKFMKFPINSEARLSGVINLIFDKAVDEPNFSKAYANMCKLCQKLEVMSESGGDQKVNFRKILITRCQNEFESTKSEPSELEEIKNCTDPEKKKELQLAYEEKERQLRMKSVGNIRFIGELFKLGMLTPAIMFRCIEHLLNTPEEESLECLCKLLTTIGKDLENVNPVPKGPQFSLNPYFQKMAELAQKKEGSKVSSRVRFMLQDVIDLRSNRWVPRREDNNPKTIDQITKEAERESFENTMALSQQPPRMNRQNDRPDDRRRGNRGGNLQNEDGWNTVGGNSRFNKFSQSFDASKIQNMVKPDMDLNSLSLGGSSMFRFQSSAKPETKTFTSSNAFSALQSRGEERKPPPQPTMNRRITPTPSIEKDKERQRMIQGVEHPISNDGRTSRGSSAQRERPQPPSRDGSQPRQMPLERDNKDISESKAQDRILDEKSARLAEEKLERHTVTIFEEYVNNFTTVDDVRQDIEQMYPADKRGYFVEKALQIALEKKAGTQKSIGVLLASFMEHNLFSADVVAEQLALIYEMADDIAIDVPKVWDLQAQVVVPIFAAERMNFSHFKSACSSVLKTAASPKLLVPVLNLLAQEKDPGFVRQVWDSSKVSLEDFLPSNINCDAFIKENSLEYLTGEAPVDMDQVQSKILRLMKDNRPIDELFDFISNTVGDKVEDLQFIRALTTAICEACIAGSNNYSLDTTKLKQYEKLIQRFVDNKEDRELACLCAVHILLCRLEHPQGLIKSIFNFLFENSLISCESFLKWRQDDQEKLENKGVSVLSLGSFFTALEESETDEENS